MTELMIEDILHVPSERQISFFVSQKSRFETVAYMVFGTKLSLSPMAAVWQLGRR